MDEEIRNEIDRLRHVVVVETTPRRNGSMFSRKQSPKSEGSFPFPDSPISASSSTPVGFGRTRANSNIPSEFSFADMFSNGGSYRDLFGQSSNISTLESCRSQFNTDKIYADMIQPIHVCTM